MTIQEKIDILRNLNKKQKRQLDRIASLRAVAENEIEGDGLTQETCEAMADALRGFHKLTHSSDIGGHLVHQDMTAFVPEGMNEGPKDFPP